MSKTEEYNKDVEKAKAFGIAIEVDGKPVAAEELKKQVESAEKLLDKAQELGVDIEKNGDQLPLSEIEASVKKVEAENKEASKTISVVKNKKKKGEKTIKVLKSLAGKYLLSHTVGEVVNIEAKQADEICEDGYGKEV